MTTRFRLPQRRAATTFDFEVGGQHYTATVGRFDDGAPSEIFLTNGKAGSDSNTAARDCAVVASIALQYGAPVEVIRRALMRNRDDSACGPLGVALDLLDKDGVP
jgi:hypothetical protein